MTIKLTASIIAAGTGATLKRATAWVAPIQAACDEFAINTSLRAAAFLAEIGCESEHLIYEKEIWGPTPAQRAYEPPSSKAKELGNTEVGDGRRYCGRGLIELTGRSNYARVGAALSLDLINHPELLELPVNAARSAAYYWSDHNLNTLADASEITLISERINGGRNGLALRLALYSAAKRALRI
jgi:putative chitinase